MPKEFYTLSDISKILGIKRERLSYWFARGFIKPSAKNKGRGRPSPWFTRGDICLIKLLGDMDTIGSLRDWRPPENPEIIGEWEAQHDFVMLVNLYILIRDVNKACDEYDGTHRDHEK